MWALNNLHSLKATHVPGKMNHGADMLSRNNVSSGEWTLHPLAVQKIWEVCCRARVDFFSSKDNSHCPIFFTKSTDALAHELPSLPLYAFPPIALLPQVLRRVREQRHELSLIALFWRNQPWVSELFQLLEAAPWPIPLRRDILSQANVMIWHPWPELWALHVWPLNGSLSGLPERVLNMMAEARAPSTWRLYALKLSVFSTWCQTTPMPRMTLWLSLCLVYSLDSPGSYSHVSLGVESFHVIAQRDCTLMQYEWIIEREFTQLLSLPSVP